LGVEIVVYGNAPVLTLLIPFGFHNTPFDEIPELAEVDTNILDEEAECATVETVEKGDVED
jgi:hypothetical protein